MKNIIFGYNGFGHSLTAERLQRWYNQLTPHS